MYRTFSKILSGLVRDITDWVVATRIKSAQLLYTMLLNEEENTTQHLEKVLTGLYRASGDEEPQVQTYVSVLITPGRQIYKERRVVRSVCVSRLTDI